MTYANLVLGILSCFLLTPARSEPISYEDAGSFLTNEVTATSGSSLKFQSVAISRNGEISVSFFRGPNLDSKVRTKNASGSWVDRLAINETDGSIVVARYDRSDRLMIAGFRNPSATSALGGIFVYRYQGNSNSYDVALDLSDTADFTYNWVNFSNPSSEPLFLAERRPIGNSALTNDYLIFAQNSAGQFVHIATAPNTHRCFGISVDSTGQKLRMGCAVSSAPESRTEFLYSIDRGLTWTRTPIPAMLDNPFRSTTARSFFDESDEWYGFHLEIAGRIAGFNNYTTALVTVDNNNPSQYRYHRIPKFDAAGLYCKDAVSIGPKLYIACGALYPDASYSAVIYSMDKVTFSFEKIHEYFGPTRNASSYLAIAAYGNIVFSGIEDRRADGTFATLARIPVP